MIVTLPWPPSKLSRNGSQGDYRGKADAAKRYREDCLLLARAMRNVTPPDGPIMLHITYHGPDNRRRDLDNLLAMTKQGIDAVAETMGVDDYRFEYTLRRGGVVKFGAVEIAV